MDNYEPEYTNDDETTVVWENLTVTVSPTRDIFFRNLWKKSLRRPYVKSLRLLKEVSGYAVTGNLIAIMGPSGAGKTTFLAALARRIELTRGSVRMNGQVCSREIMSKISSYMPQFDALPTSLTVEEYISFAHALKVPDTVSQRKFLSRELLIDLGLLDCKDTLICKLSGGQKKLVSLAMELVTRPRIIFLDEPTTGLDTFSAIRVIESIRLISLNGTIVFCTIHQPGMTLYNLFSHVILMTDGRIAYSGTLENATEFFSSQGYVCPIGFDESEYYIKLLSNRNSEVTLNNEEKEIDKICETFLRSPLSKVPQIRNSNPLKIKSQRTAGCVVQFYWLTWRIWTQSRRTIFADWISWISYLLSVAAVGTFYAGINSSTQEGVQNTRGALYMMSSEIIFTVAYSVVYELPAELLVYLRECAVYASAPYYMATFLGMIPKAVLKSLIFTVLMYLLLNSHYDLVNFFFYCLITSAAAVCGTAYGIMFSSWFEDIEIATLIMVPIDMLFLLTAGVFYNLRSLPGYLRYFKYFSLFFYINEALSSIYWTRIDKIDCQANSDLPCLSNGEEVLSEYGFKQSNFWWDIGGLALLTILMTFIGYLGTRRRRTVKTMI